ncbi:MAG: hypothetical protein F6K10_08135 [Moorea sp. SIO2B7]|nr:hypothetical protein [Moorena sp. SIO2B7]
MKNYVILGCDDSLNSLLDIISAQGNRLKKVVCHNSQMVQLSQAYLSLAFESLETFIPEPDEIYLCGLFGKKAIILHQKFRDEMGISFDTLIHPNAIISLTAHLSPGSVISAGVIIASSVVIGENCFVGQGVIFGHDTVLENYVIVQSGSKLAGHLRVGEGAIIGMGATIIEDVSIGNYARIEPGAVVLKDVASQTVVSGVPAVVKETIN